MSENKIFPTKSVMRETEKAVFYVVKGEVLGKTDGADYTIILAKSQHKEKDGFVCTPMWVWNKLEPKKLAANKDYIYVPHEGVARTTPAAKQFLIPGEVVGKEGTYELWVPNSCYQMIEDRLHIKADFLETKKSRAEKSGAPASTEEDLEAFLRAKAEQEPSNE